jgi:hypothetical protein
MDGVAAGFCPHSSPGPKTRATIKVRSAHRSRQPGWELSFFIAFVIGHGSNHF